jgi:ferritin
LIAMIDKKMQDALNEQIKWELYSGYLYLSMSAHFAGINLLGFSSWMRVQAQEELSHAMKFYDFVIERGGKVSLLAVDAPPLKWASPLAAFKEAYEHEQHVTSRINDLVTLAQKMKDHATHIFLQWFVTEQVEEEASADGVVQQLKLIGKDSSGLFMVDRELGQRTFTPPAPSE